MVSVGLFSADETAFPS